MKLYISGGMSGYPDHNKPAFRDAALLLGDAGHEVVNPAEMGEHEGWTHADYMRRDLPYVFECDGIAVLPGAEYSGGAQAEMALGRAIGLDVLPVDVWVMRAAR